MISVIVKVWGPVDAAPGSYDWISVGRIKEPKSLDVDYLKKKVMKFVRDSDYTPHTDAVRLEVVINGNTEMKMTVVDFFKSQKEVK